MKASLPNGNSFILDKRARYPSIIPLRHKHRINQDNSIYVLIMHAEARPNIVFTVFITVLEILILVNTAKWPRSKPCHHSILAQHSARTLKRRNAPHLKCDWCARYTPLSSQTSWESPAFMSALLLLRQCAILSAWICKQPRGFVFQNT